MIDPVGALAGEELGLSAFPRRRTNSAPRRSKFSVDRPAQNRSGHSTVALRIKSGDRVQVVGEALTPSRAASNGMLPPPAVGSKHDRYVRSQGDRLSYLQPLQVILPGQEG